MNKSDIAKQIAERNGLSSETARDAADAVLEAPAMHS